MSFVENSSQQLSFDDSIFNLTEREQRFLNSSWAKDFSDKIFPAIDEKLFAVLYSDKDSRPNTPVNVIVGAMILKEFMNLTDDEMVQSLMFDVRYQYALHTTSFKEQPLSDRTFSRFRARVVSYETLTGIDLIHACMISLSGQIAEFMNITPTLQRMDSLMVSANIRNISMIELFYRCVADLLKVMSKNDDTIPENLSHYLDKDDYNKIVYHMRSINIKERIKTVLIDAVQLSKLCSGRYDETSEYQLLIRLLNEQAIEDDGKYRLRTKEEKVNGSHHLINPADPEATCSTKAGKKHFGYVANVVESVGETGSVVTEYMYEQNTHSDSEFAREYMESLPENGEEITLVTDGTYGSERNSEIAKQHNVNFVNTNFTGLKLDEIYADFVISEDGSEIVECPNKQVPLKSKLTTRRKRNNQNKIYTAHYPKETCEQCPYRDRCKPIFQKNTARKEVPYSMIRHAKQQLYMKTEDFRNYARFRNGVETIPSILRRKYHVDKIPAHRKIPTKLHFGFKIAALNFNKLLKYLSSQISCAIQPERG